MTHEEILNMEAGRIMDITIAEEVMGWSGKERFYPDIVPHYSTDIAAAWEVVEKMMEIGDVFIEFWSDGEWFVAPHPLGYSRRNGASCDGRKTGIPSAPLAICRAALLVVLSE